MKLIGCNTGRTFAAAAAVLCLSCGIQARADVVMDWNATAVAVPQLSPPVLARVLAAMHGAVHDAVNAIDPVYEPYRFRIRAPAGASKEAAAATAAHDVLAALLPEHRSTFDAALAQSLSGMPEGQPKVDGIAVGRTAAQSMVASRAKDNFDAKAHDNPGTAPGAWQRTPPAMLAGALPHFGGVTPFVLKAADQFAAKGRPALSSSDFVHDMKEIKAFGARHSKARTAEQTAVAIFWSGNEIPVLNAAARAASQARKLSMQDNARLFALVHMAAADAAIAAFRIKYSANDWRPVTAIRLGYGPLAADPAWEPLLITPPHPEYPSGHCIVTGATMAVLREFFRSDQVKLDYVYPPALGVVRSFASFSQIEKEVEDARVWGGIHFRSTDEHSTALGRQIGAYTIATAMRPLPMNSAATEPLVKAGLSR
jgi:hypothetical protein